MASPAPDTTSDVAPGVAPDVTADVAVRRARTVAVIAIVAVIAALSLAAVFIPSERLVPWLAIVGITGVTAVIALGLARADRSQAGAWVLVVGVGIALLVAPVSTADLGTTPLLVAPWCAGALLLLGRRMLAYIAGAAAVLLVLMAMFAPPSEYRASTLVELLVSGTIVSLVTAVIVVYGMWERAQTLSMAHAEATEARRLCADLEREQAHLERTAVERERALEEVVRDQEQLVISLTETAVRDPRTGLLNGRHHKRHWLRAIADSRASGLPLSVIAFDLDHFGRINKEYSHQAGDAVLEEFASLIRRLVRPGDLPYRLGQGEEFVVLLPHTRQDEAELVAERVRVTCRKHVWPHLDTEHRLTVSAGVTQRDPESEDRWVDVLARADQALAAAKEAGRDRVVRHEAAP